MMLPAATSTGKQWRRIGDSPLIGTGTYARDGDCAISATVTGEYFIRDSAGRQVCKPAFAINDIGMYRGTVSSDSPVIQTAIYGDEKLK